jgi:ribosomal protein S18 acetylase RimI-like enzyme
MDVTPPGCKGAACFSGKAAPPNILLKKHMAPAYLRASPVGIELYCRVSSKPRSISRSGKNVLVFTLTRRQSNKGLRRSFYMAIQKLETEISYRRMLESDLPAAHKLSQAVRWPHRLEDWQFVHHLGSGFVAERDGEVIGTALCWSHGNHYASLGMIIVSPEAQGCGIGRALMESILDDIGERNTLLFATPAGQPLYERLGFKAIGKVHQHQGTIVQPEVVAPPAGERIRPLGTSDRARLIELAAGGVGMPRAAVFNELLQVAEGVVLDSYGELTGFALMRRFGHGYAIGPVVAPDAERAKAMISYWVGARVDSFVRIDVHDSSQLSPWLSELGLVQVDTVVAMVKGEAPEPVPGLQQFAIINQALG